MRKFLLLIVLAIAVSAQAQVEFFDDFEGYTADDYLCTQSDDWVTWNTGAEGTDEDCFVVTETAYSGSQCIKLESQSATGGPMDIFFPIGYSTGTYVISWYQAVFQDNGSYFNLQTTTTPGDGWAMNVFFNANGTVTVTDGANAPAGGTTYTPNEWMLISITVDLDADMASLAIDGTEVSSIAHPSDLGGVNFYPLGGESDPTSLCYVDDFQIVNATSSVNDIEAVDYTMYPNPVSEILTIDYGQDLVSYVRVINISGQEVMNFAPQNDNGISTVDVSTLSEGIYFVELTSQGIRSTKKLVVRR